MFIIHKSKLSLTKKFQIVIVAVESPVRIATAKAVDVLAAKNRSELPKQLNDFIFLQYE
jgi:hypothetical protein